MDLFLYGEKRLSPRLHWFSALMVFLGSWLSGYFIIVTDAWMQHPVGYAADAERLGAGDQLLETGAESMGVAGSTRTT